MNDITLLVALIVFSLAIIRVWCAFKARLMLVSGGGGGGEAEQIAGLDEAVIATYPRLPYSQVKQRYSGGNSTAGSACCPICLADYKDDELILLLPVCVHFFHLNCVDPWLRAHPNCPVCRSSLVRVSQFGPNCHPTSDALGGRQNFVSNDMV